MNTVVALTVALALVAPNAAAQSTPTKDRAEVLREARVKMWGGAALIAAGAFMIPITDVGRTSGSPTYIEEFALISGGGALMYWGFRQQRQALQQPSTTFGMTVGKRNGFVVRRSW
jgi:hypothetical protein